MIATRGGPGRRPGLTLIEVLVAVAIIGLLMALLASAVQAARESARRSQCTNNLRQIGVAVLSYEAAHGSLPMGTGSNGFSFQVAILPDLEMGTLYHAFNFGTNRIFPDGVNLTAGHRSPGVFLCPSDPHRQDWAAFVNYVGSRGVGVQKYGYNGAFTVAGSGVVRLREVVDGTSQTALASEWVTGGDAGRDPLRAVFDTPEPMLEPGRFDAFAAACRGLDPQTAVLNHSLKGLSWTFGDIGFTLYNHTLAPDQNTCTNGMATQQGAWTAGSRHPGGVNLLLIDGHIRFVSRSVRLEVWRALGSRDGGEVIDAGDL